MAEKKLTKEDKKTPILTQIQSELKAPKNQYNDFGHYNYRNAEDIESGLKPLLIKYGCEMTITDEPIMIGDWHYIKAEVILTTPDRSTDYISHGYAREEFSKKGQDASQTSGSASSYARKYALGGMFLIDDTKDADSMKPSSNQRKSPQKETLKQRIAKAKFFEVQYGGGREKLLDICKLEAKGDHQAELFLEDWRKKSPGNEKAYQFIKKEVM